VSIGSSQTKQTRCVPAPAEGGTTRQRQYRATSLLEDVQGEARFGHENGWEQGSNTAKRAFVL
jgi:hypothetical protein